MVNIPVKTTCRLKYWYTYKRDFSAENMRKFLNSLGSLSFDEVYHSDVPDTAFNIFHDYYTLFYELCFPKIRTKISSSRKPKWITKGIKLCSKRRRHLLWKYRLYPTVTNKSIFKNYARRYKKVINLTQKAQNDYYIGQSKNKSKATWRVINDCSNNLPKESVSKILVDDVEITDPEQLSNTFNDFFVDSVKITNTNKPRPYTILSNQPNSIFLSPTSPFDILKIINTLKNTNSVGHDEVSTRIIKSSSHIIAPVLSFIINLCLEQGIFPERLKLTIIIPIFKKDNTKLLKNYRPIALISIFSKIIENVIYEKVYNYFEVNNLLTDKQYGFRKKLSINLALFEFFEKVVANVSQRKLTLALFMDMTKAFENVNHKTLLQKLENYGVRGNANKLIESYLTNRRQITHINKVNPQTGVNTCHSSHERLVTNGVPQGSVLGPLLFIIYINDLPNVTNHFMTLFADDSTILFTFDNVTDIELDINNTLHSLINWLTSNNLTINLSKTYLIKFQQRNNSALNYNINYLDTTIKEITTTKFLGLTIDNRLTWKYHIDDLVKRLNQFSYALSKLKKVSNIRTLLTAYHGYVASKLRYGIMFWGNTTDKEKVFKSQKKCIRSMFSLKQDDSCQPYFRNYRILTLPSMYISEIAIFIKNNPQYFEIHPTGSRREGTLKAACVGQGLLKRMSVGSMAHLIFNNIPKSIRDINSIKLFKSTFNGFLADKAYYDIRGYLNHKNN